MRIYGVNSVLEALRAGKVSKIYIEDSKNPKISRIVQKAKKAGVPVYKVRKLPEKIAADVSPVRYVKMEDIMEKALAERSFILVLDNIEDQQNLGACIRTAEFFGCAGIIIPNRRAAQVGEGAVRASAGAVFHVSIAREENLASALKKLKKYGFFVVGADVSGEDISNFDLSPPVVIVVGGEDRGISVPVRKQCDHIVAIQRRGKTNSLNLSVAAGIIMYEVARRC